MKSEVLRKLAPVASLAVLLPVAATLSGCGLFRPTKALATINLSHASVGNEERINSDDLEPGDVILLDLSSGHLDEFKSVDNASKLMTRSPAGNGHQTKLSVQASSSGDVDIEVPNIKAFGATNIAKLKVEVSKAGQLTLERYFKQSTKNLSGDLPNAKETLNWRQGVDQQYKDKPNYIFAIVTAATYADNAEFSVGPLDDKGAPANSFQTTAGLGSNEIVKVSYKNNSRIDKEGTAFPAVVKYKFFRLVSNPGSSGAKVRFNPVSPEELPKIKDTFIKALRQRE